MKKLLFYILIFLPVGTFAAPAIVQTKSQNGGGYVNSFTSTFTTSVTSGNTIIMYLTGGNGDIPTITDNQGNGYFEVASTTDERRTWMYTAYNVTGGTVTVTMQNTPGVFSDFSLIMREYSGLTTTNPLDRNATGNDGGAYIQTHTSNPTGTTAQASELVVGCGGSSGSTYVGWSAGSGYGNLATQDGFDLYTYGAMEDLILSSIGTPAASFSTIEYVRGQVITGTYKASGASPVSPPSNIRAFFNGIININGRLNLAN